MNDMSWFEWVEYMMEYKYNDKDKDNGSDTVSEH